jgi:hypothetical protein
MEITLEENIASEAKDSSFTRISGREGGSIDGKPELNDLRLKVYAWTECIFVNLGAHICCHTFS